MNLTPTPSENKNSIGSALANGEGKALKLDQGSLRTQENIALEMKRIKDSL